MFPQLYHPALQAAIARYFGHLSPEATQALIAQLEWVELLSGATLLQAGAPADGMYILLAGRLSVYAPSTAGRPQLIGSIFRGETVGEMGLLTDSPRNATVVASRDAVLVKINQVDFQAISEQYPAILREFAQTIISRLQQANQQTLRRLKPNIAFVPLHSLPAIDRWLEQVNQALLAYEPTYLVNQASAARELGLELTRLDEAEAMGSLNRWLAEVDSRNEYTLYQAEANLTNWTRKCVRQADLIYLVADPQQARLDEELLAYLQARRQRHPEVRYQLLLLHEPGTAHPTGTLAWLERIQPDQHHHLRREHPRDCRRLARLISDRTVGMACGGGGAKGLAHIGVFKALRELEVEVDCFGGTSIGAILAATQALDWSEEQLMAACHKTFVEGSISNDYQLPFYSLLKGRKKERVLKAQFDYQIEDLWYNFFCVSSNLSTNRMIVHERGSLWEAITASSALPGVFPPFIQGGDFLVDGAFMNNLPGDLLRERGCDFLLSVDVSIAKAIHAEAEVFPSSWEVFKRRFRGRKRKSPRFPSIFQTFMRASYLASTKHSTQVNQLADIALQPPVKRIGLMGWDKMEQAIEVGYAYTLAHFETHQDELAGMKAGKGKAVSEVWAKGSSQAVEPRV
jgi:NTE family protein